MRESSRYVTSQFSGRNRRLLYEWQQLDELLEGRLDISCNVIRRNTAGLPTAYLICYQLKSICGVTDMEHFGEPGVKNMPVYATGYKMRIDLPDCYPSVDAPPSFRFLLHDEQGQSIPHPWHPNIRYSGSFKGHVCLNSKDMGVMASIKSLILRVEQYLKYQDYHAENIYPYPEDQNVAEWVREEAEPNGWTRFPQDRMENVEPAQPKPVATGTPDAPKKETPKETPTKTKRILNI